MKTKVMQFIFALNDGGAETLVKDYDLLLDKDKFDVDILTIQSVSNTANYKTLLDNNINIINIFPDLNIFYKLINKFFKQHYIPYKIKKIIKKEQPSCIHVHLSLLKYLKPISKELKGIKLFYTCHSLPDKFFEVGSQDMEAAKYLINNNDLQLIGLHKSMVQELDKMFNVDNTVLIRNGVDFSKFETVGESKSDIRKEIGIPINAFVIGHIGRFSYAKNHSLLLDIFCEVLKRNTLATLLLVGTGELKEVILKKAELLGISDRVYMLEHRTDVNRILKAMDVFVFPSLYEGFPVSLVEAQVARLKCVVSNSVTQECYLTEKTIPVDINAPAYEWAEIICDDSVRNLEYGQIENYDLRNEIKKLEELYIGE